MLFHFSNDLTAVCILVQPITGAIHEVGFRQGLLVNIYLHQGAMFSWAIVCYLAALHKSVQQIFTKFGKKVAHGLQKKLLDFGGNPDYVTSEVWLE